MSSPRPWFRARVATEPGPRPARTPARARLKLEAMEDRTVPSTINGVVFDDVNHSGTPDAGEGGHAGWTAFLDINRNSVLDPGETSTLTNAAGGYSFDTTNEPPAQVGQTTVRDYVAIALPTGIDEDGRWMNTTATFAPVDRNIQPDAVRNFGAYHQSFAGAAVQPDGPEAAVNVATDGVQGSAVVAADAAGNYTVAWRTTEADGTGTYVARVFNADGTPRDGQFVVATGIAANVGGPPEVAMSRDGTRVIVAWPNFSAANQSSSTSYRVYTGTGSEVTSGAVSLGGGTATTSVSLNGVAADATGNAVILYKTNTYSKNWGWQTPTLKAQRLTAAGAATGAAITVDSLSLINGSANVAMNGAGKFVVVWDESTGNSRNPGSAVFAQCYTASGSKAGGLITIASGSDTAAGHVWRGSVAMNASGRIAVAYIFGNEIARVRLFNHGGTPVGSAMDVTTGTFGGGIPVGVAMDDAGTVTFTWTDNRSPTPGTSYAYGSGEIRVRQLSATGILGDVLIVNTTTQGAQSGATVAATGAGTFVVVWEGYGPGDDSGIFMQQYQPA